MSDAIPDQDLEATQPVEGVILPEGTIMPGELAGGVFIAGALGEAGITGFSDDGYRSWRSDVNDLVSQSRLATGADFTTPETRQQFANDEAAAHRANKPNALKTRRV